MDDRPPTTQELLEQLNGFEKTRTFNDSSTDAAHLFDNVPPHDVVGGLGAGKLEEWITRTARQFGVEDDGLGRMLVAQMAMVHNRIGRLMDHQEFAEAASILAPWTNAAMKLMAEFRRSYMALCELRDAREKKRQHQAETQAATSNGRSCGKKRNGFVIERHQLNGAN